MNKRESLASDLFNRMLEIAKAPKDAVADQYWKFNYTLSREEFSSFKAEGVGMIQKALKVNKRKAISIFNYFYNNYGLRLKG